MTIRTHFVSLREHISIFYYKNQYFVLKFSKNFRYVCVCIYSFHLEANTSLWLSSSSYYYYFFVHHFLQNNPFNPSKLFFLEINSFFNQRIKPLDLITSYQFS